MDKNRDEQDETPEERIKQLEQKLLAVQAAKDAAIKSGDFEKAVDMREEEITLKVELSAICPERDIMDRRDRVLVQSSKSSRLDLLEAKVSELEARIDELEGKGKGKRGRKR